MKMFIFTAVLKRTFFLSLRNKYSRRLLLCADVFVMSVYYFIIAYYLSLLCFSPEPDLSFDFWNLEAEMAQRLREYEIIINSCV